MRWFLAITTVTGFAVYGAVADNIINEHSGYYVKDVHYTIRTSGNNDIAVEINKGSVANYIWKFEAYDSVTGDPGYIDYIVIDPTDTVGPIKLSIVGSVGHTYGAENVKEINLITNADDTTEIVGVNISGDLATAGDVLCHNVTGDIVIGGDFGHNPSGPDNDLRVNTCTADIVIGGDSVGDIDLGDGVTGDITIGELLLGDLEVGCPQNVTISGVGEHTGNIYFDAPQSFTYVLAIGNPSDPNDFDETVMSGDICMHGRRPA